MSTHKYVDYICVAVLVCTVLLTVLFMNGERLGIQVILNGDSAGSTDSSWFTRNDRNGAWNAADAAKITLLGDHANVFGGGAYVYDGDVIIAYPGHYLITGALDDGSIVVSADDNDKVWIMLDGVELNCSDDACLRVDQADKVFVTLAEGSENSMTSGAEYSEEALKDNRGGVLFSRDDLTINGSGSLRIASSYKHGIDVNDELVITGGSLRVEAPGDAIHVNDALRVENASLSLLAGDEGIDLRSADSLLYIASGSMEIESTGAGIKGAADMLAEGGSIDIRSEADAVHLGGSFRMADGALRLASGDDGIHADKSAEIMGGSVTISECYEGIEALTIDIGGGEISIYPSDDGLNANGGSDRFGPFAARDEDAAEEETWVRVSGGSLTIVNSVARDADGIDSNGDIYISGGVVRVSLSSSGSNSAIDFGSENGGVCEISGGEVIACGSYIMAESFSDTSEQCSILYNISYGVAADTEIRLEDLDGNVLLSYTAPCAFSSVALSSPALKLGETYTLVLGEKAEQITLKEVSAAYGDVESGGFGGPMNFGQMRPREDMPGGRRPEEDGSRPRPSDRPTPPDFGGVIPDFGGDMPTPPDFGEMPDFGGDMPTPPDFGEMPDFGGDMPTPPDFGGGKGPGQKPTEEQLPEEETAEEIVIGPQPVSADTWIMLGACLLVLLLGILYAVSYKQ